jgi:putative ABC transport system permease protein
MNRYLLLWPMANIRGNPWISVTSVLGVAAAAFVVTTLLGFLAGYETAVRRDVDRMGYDLLITAKGCPYEAATLMLRGGVGLRYMPDGVVARLDGDDRVLATHPTLIHPVREPSNPQGMAIYKGVSTGLYEALGLAMSSGSWFPQDGGEAQATGVILGYEAAEFEARHAGDAYLIPAATGRDAVKTTVLGVLERTGTQMDGAVLLPLAQIQSLFGLTGKLTGVGVQTDPKRPDAAAALREAYHAEAELQVVSLSQVEAALRRAMVAMGDVVAILAAVLALLAAAILVNTSLLRLMSEHKRYVALHAIGLSRTSLALAAAVESLILAGAGTVLGLALASAGGRLTSMVLADYVPYVPAGELVAVPPSVSAAVLGGALGLALLTALVPMIRLRRLGDLSDLRGT